MIRRLVPFAVMFVVGAAAYTLLSRLLFQMPATLAEAEACGFTAAEFGAGRLTYSPQQAWFLSFFRKQEYLTAGSIGLILAFLLFAVGKVRRSGLGATSGVMAGSGLVAAGSLCLSCLAPALSAIGLGVVGSFALGMPKWLMALNTVLFVSWGTLFLSRRQATSCPAPLLSAVRNEGGPAGPNYALGTGDRT